MHVRPVGSADEQFYHFDVVLSEKDSEEIRARAGDLRVSSSRLLAAAWKLTKSFTDEEFEEAITAAIIETTSNPIVETFHLLLVETNEPYNPHTLASEMQHSFPYRPMEGCSGVDRRHYVLSMMEEDMPTQKQMDWLLENEKVKEWKMVVRREVISGDAQ